MNLRFLLPLLGLLLSPLALSAPPAPDGDWKLISDRNGIRVFVGSQEHSKLKAFRGETILELPDEYAMLALYNDTDAFPEWLHMITTAELMGERTPLDRDLRFTIRLPWPLQDREVLVNAKLEQHVGPEREAVTAWLTGVPELMPPNPDYLRLPEMGGMFSFTRVEPRRVRAVFQVSMDMGGYLPNWLANMVLRDLPYFTLDKLRRIVHRPEYQNHYYDYLDLMGPGRPADLPPPRSWVYGTGLPADDEPPAVADGNA